jgi:hypothetical protein
MKVHPCLDQGAPKHPPRLAHVHWPWCNFWAAPFEIHNHLGTNCKTYLLVLADKKAVTLVEYRQMALSK